MDQNEGELQADTKGGGDEDSKNSCKDMQAFLNPRLDIGGAVDAQSGEEEAAQ